ncbi:MAG: hypothetical protein RL631_1764, partial [Pseudomonadota bacterium]
TFEVGFARGVAALELAFELKIEFAAFGDKMAFDVITFGGFA